MSQLTLYNWSSRDRDPRKAAAWTKLGRFRTAQWPRAAPLGQTLQRQLRLSAFCILPSAFCISQLTPPGTAATEAISGD